MSGRHKAIRLPPLNTLRVHDPKRKVENPCIAIMSSVLGTFPAAPPLSTLNIRHADRLVHSMLGLCRIQCHRVRRHRDTAPQVHGRPRASPRARKHNQLPPLTNAKAHDGAEEAKVGFLCCVGVGEGT